MTELLDWEGTDGGERKWWHYDDCSVTETINPANHIIEKKEKKVQNDKIKNNITTTGGKKKSKKRNVDDNSNDDLMEIDDEEYSDEKIKKSKIKPKQKMRQKASVTTESLDEESVIIADENVLLVDSHEGVVPKVFDLSTDAEVEIEVEVGRIFSSVNPLIESTMNIRSSKRLTSTNVSSSSNGNRSATSKMGNNVSNGSTSNSTIDPDPDPNSESTSILKRKRPTKKIPSPKEPGVQSTCDSPIAVEGDLININPDLDITESDKGDTQTLPKFPALDRSKDAYILCYVKQISIKSCFRRQRQLPSSIVSKSVEETSNAFLTEIGRYALKRDLITNQISERKRIFQEISQLWLPCRDHVQGDEPYHLLPTAWLSQWCSGEVNKKADKIVSGNHSKKGTDLKDRTVDLTSPPKYEVEDTGKGMQSEMEGARDDVTVNNYIPKGNSGGDALQLLDRVSHSHIDMTVTSDIDHQYQNNVKDAQETKRDDSIDQEIGTETSEGKSSVHSRSDAPMSKGSGILSALSPIDPDSSLEVGNEYDYSVFDESADDHILPLLCPHYLINGVCSVHPDNITAFKVVTHRAYSAIMATVNSGKKSQTTSGRLDSISSDLKNGGSDIGSHHDLITEICSNCETSDKGYPLDSSERELYPINSYLQNSHARVTGIDVTSETYRCESCYSEVLSKRSSLQVMWRERERERERERKREI